METRVRSFTSPILLHNMHYACDPVTEAVCSSSSNFRRNQGQLPVYESKNVAGADYIFSVSMGMNIINEHRSLLLYSVQFDAEYDNW